MKPIDLAWAILKELGDNVDWDKPPEPPEPQLGDRDVNWCDINGDNCNKTSDGKFRLLGYGAGNLKHESIVNACLNCVEDTNRQHQEELAYEEMAGGYYESPWTEELLPLIESGYPRHRDYRAAPA